MTLDELDYPLPKELIAHAPLAERDRSRLLVCERATRTLTDRVFADIAGLIPAGDALVMNDTKVFPARLLGKKKKTEGKAELLLLHPADESGRLWKALLQPAMREGQELVFGAVEAVFLRRDAAGIPLVEFPEGADVRALAERIGTMPLPPYIKREPTAADAASYQTVYARHEGAVAAPTAGLHFTPELLERLRAGGVELHTVTLHVGYGTFKPVEDLENHRMHSERFELKPETADRLNTLKASGKKIWAVGTTTLRVLETCVQNKRLIPGKSETDLYIREPFTFEAVDRLITNFHLPKTTLLLLVSAFMGEALRRAAYEHAIAERYRFYSYGDAMLII